MSAAFHNVKSLHKRIDVSKLQRLEDEAAAANDALEGRFARYLDRTYSGRALHRQAIQRAADMEHYAAHLSFADLAALPAEEMEAAGIALDLVERAAIEFESAATLFAEWQRENAIQAQRRALVGRLREYAEGVRG